MKNQPYRGDCHKNEVKGPRMTCIISPTEEGVFMSKQGGDSEIGFYPETANDHDWPSVRQFNVFLANRLGGMLSIVKRFENSSLKIVSLMVIDSADCAIIRIVLSDPVRAKEIFHQADLAVTESDLLVVRLPDNDQPLFSIFKELLQAEVNIDYAYPLMVGPRGSAALALHVEDLELAAKTLKKAGFDLFTEDDLALGELLT